MALFKNRSYTIDIFTFWSQSVTLAWENSSLMPESTGEKKLKKNYLPTNKRFYKS